MNERGPFFEKRIVIVGLAGQIVICLALLPDALPPMAVVNESPSLPRGLYFRDWGAEPDRGSVVAFPQPDPVRPYLRQLGMADEFMLIKRVAAEGGDLACFDGDAVRLPRATLTVMSHDRKGAPLPRWRQCRRLDPGEVFVVGDTLTSLDSRYFGPVGTDSIQGVFREAVRW